MASVSAAAINVPTSPFVSHHHVAARRSTLDPPPCLSPQPYLRPPTLECPSPSQTHQEWAQSSPRIVLPRLQT
jgi:hypothetical protein